MIMDTNLKLFSTSNNDTNTATVSTRDEEEDSSITTSSMNTSTSSAEGVHCSTNANNSAERSRRGESSESDNSRKSDSWINGKMTEKASATCHPKVGSGANLVFDDFYLARILTKICPTKFSPNWLYPMKQSYWESYLDDTKSLPRVFRDGDEFESTPEEFLTFVSFDDSDEINSTYRIRCPIRYLSNVGTILEDIKWYLERKERQQTQQRSDSQDGGDNASGDFVVVNGTASGGATTATSSNVVLGSSSTTDVDLLLEDIRSYVWTIVKSIDSKSSKECLIRQQQQQHSSVLKQSIDDDEEKENKALNSIDGNGHQPTQCNDHCDDETVASRTLDTTRQRQTSAESNTSSASSCSFGTSSLKPQFGSILCRLAKVLHGCIESEDTRYSFYHIFNSIARCDKLDFISNSFRKNLNNLINSLANFDLNSGQIMLDATNVSNGPTGKVCKTNSHTDNQRDCSPVIGPQSQSLTASSSLANHFFATGTTHFYQSVLDSCGDDLSTSGGSTASSGYGRSSTASNSSGTGLTSGLGLGAASATQLDSGHPSPTPPVSFRDILAKPTPQNRNSVSPSTGVIGRPSSVEHSNESTLNSCNFLNTQFATSDLCDMNEIPKLISPPNPSVMPQLRHHHNSGATDLYGSDLFDLSSISTKDRLPSLSNHHGNLPRGIIEDNRHHNSNQSNSTFFSDFSNSGLLFGSSNSSGNSQINGNSSNHHDLFSNNDAATIRMGNSHNSPFMVSPIPPVGSTPNQCFTISLDQQAKQESFDEQSDLLDKRTAVAIAAACLTEPTFPPNQNNNNGNSQSNHDSSVPLCDRDLFYRLIISQLLFHGHRNIANQLAAAERIKADGSLLSPNDRLHSLVSNAIRREIDLLRNSAETTPSFTSRASSVVTNITNSNPYQMDSLTSSSFINGNGNGGVKDSSQQNLSTLNRSLVDDSATYSKTIYDRSQSSHGYSSIGTSVSNQIFGGASSAGASRLGIDTNDSTDNLDYVVDVPLDSDMVYTNPSDMYFGSTSSTRSSISTVTSPGLLKQMSHPAVHQLDSHRSQSSASLRSNGIELGAVGTPGTVRSPPTVLDLNNSTSGAGAGSVGGFLLNENAMKNLNQLASKLNDDALSGASTNPIYGRSASAMAMSSNTSVTSVATTLAAQQPMGSGSSYQGQLSRSPIPMMPLNGGMPAKSSNFSTTSNVVPVGPLGPLGPSHTTGNGKNHKIMQIRSKFGSLGSQSNQFSSPHGFCLGMNEEIVIADTNNHRISVYEKNGTFKHSFGSAGKDEGQLWYPRKITMICSPNVRGSLQNPFYVICDRGMERSRMQIFTRNGNFVRKIPIRYIDIVAGIAVNAYGQIVTVDSVSPTIFIISELGELLEWFDCSDHMREPSDIAVFKKEYYICDFKGHCVVVFSERGKCLRKIGIESLTSFPNGIDISTNGDILVGDSHGNRFHVAIFNQEGKLLTEYECPYVKVSRCCGLKLTSEGYVVTLAKNNHHVLVLNTLYIT